MLTDQEILDKIQAGDKQAFEELFRAYYTELCHFACKYVGDPDQAEEIVQDHFVSFWNKRESLQVTTSLKSYLYQSIKHAALNSIKHQTVRANYAEAQIPYVENYAIDYSQAFELQKSIEQSIDKLPAERKKIFLLSREDGLKYKEIASQLNLSVKTVEAQMGKALKFLREDLQEYLVVLCIMWFDFMEWLKNWL